MHLGRSSLVTGFFCLLVAVAVVMGSWGYLVSRCLIMWSSMKCHHCCLSGQGGKVVDHNCVVRDVMTLYQFQNLKCRTIRNGAVPGGDTAPYGLARVV